MLRVSKVERFQRVEVGEFLVREFLPREGLVERYYQEVREELCPR